MNEDQDAQAAVGKETGTAPAAAPRLTASDDRVACPACVRMNPTTRQQCIYCGASLPQTADSDPHARLTLHAPEPWEPGFNLVLLPAAQTGARTCAMPVVRAEVRRLLGAEETTLDEIAKSLVPVPLARVSNEQDAHLAARRLSALRLEVIVVPDADLVVRPGEIKRVRRLEISGADLQLWCRAGDDDAEPTTIPLADVIALVRGRLFTKETEVVRPHRRGGRENVNDAPPFGNERAMFDDESVLDIYADALACTWRISAGSFDYSCLGARRALLARDNFEMLIAALRLAAGTALYDDAYMTVRSLLDSVWSLTERTDARGRSRSARRIALQTATLTSNEDQFTRYARTRAHLERERRRHQPGRAEEDAPHVRSCT